MKIDINISISGREIKKSEAEEEYTDFPTDPYLFDDDPEYILDVCFYDGSQIVDPQASDGSGYSVEPHFEFNELQTDTTHTSRNGNSFRFVQNTNTISAEDIAKAWDWTDSTRQYSIFARPPMKRILLEDYLANDSVLPVGCLRPNMLVTLKYPNGDDAVRIDHMRVFKTGVEGACGDVIIDDEDIAGYRIYEPPFSMGHIKVEEITANSVIAYLDAEYYLPGWRTVQNQMQDELQGIFWLGFDTSDTTNYKMTRLPYYDAEEFLDVPVRMTAQYAKCKVYLMPRRWWVYSCYRTGNSDQSFGIWCRPPKDLALPPPRKRGLWELAGAWYIPDDGSGEFYCTERNAHAIFDLKPGEGLADGDDRNAFYMVHSYHEMHTFLQGDWNSKYHVPWVTTLSESYHRFFTVILQGDSNIVGPSAHTPCQTMVLTCMPDGKTPYMYATKTFQCEQGDPPGPSVYRTVNAYSSTGFSTQGRNEIEKILTHVQSLDIAKNTGLSGTPSTWMVCASGAKEGDLVGVLETGDGFPIYVWRRTEEEFTQSNSFELQDPLWFLGIADNFQYSANENDNTRFFNCYGHIEWNPLKRLGTNLFSYNRVIRKWGSWVDISPTDPAVIHRETIDLGHPTSVIMYFSDFPN